MVRDYWKPVCASALFMMVISVNGRPSDISFENDLSDRSGVQILEINSLDANAENEHKNAILKKLLYNVSQAGLHIPVQVIYDLPDTPQQRNQSKDARSDRNSRRRNLTDVDKIKETIKNMYFGVGSERGDGEPATDELVAGELNRTNSALALIINRPEFFQRVNNTRKKVPIIFHLFSPPSSSAAANAEQNTSTNAGHQFIIPILDKLKELNGRPATPSTPATVAASAAVPAAAYQEPLASQTAPASQWMQTPSASLQPAAVAMPPFAPAALPSAPSALYPPMGLKKVPSPFYYGNPSPPYFGLPPAASPSSYLAYPPLQYYAPPAPYDPYRQWPYPFAGYPTPNTYPLHLNYVPESMSAEYIRGGGGGGDGDDDICRAKSALYPNYGRARRTFAVDAETNREDDDADDDDDDDDAATVSSNKTVPPPPSPPSPPNTNGEYEFGKRRYDDVDDATLIEYVDNVRRHKRNASRRKDRRPLNVGPIERRDAIAVPEAKREATPLPPAAAAAATAARQGSDVGPQISKLIVRRGGVAIAGAGGIATAGSGGTAIVGPGGTAFTTPASSGGVAMVGPGGKVVKVPDLTNVLYGRTANVAATGAGHATFTNKEGEVFTTSDQTGGVALVNPSGGLFGVSDGENALEYGQKTGGGVAGGGSSGGGETKEVQLPAGARLLTTGPIIYYNPVYPTSGQL